MRAVGRREECGGRRPPFSADMATDCAVRRCAVRCGCAAVQEECESLRQKVEPIASLQQNVWDHSQTLPKKVDEVELGKVRRPR